MFELAKANADAVCMENPVGVLPVKASQYVQPYEHGHAESKKTGLWLHNLPKLQGGTEGKSVLFERDFHSSMMRRNKNLLDAKSLERVLSVNNFDPMAVNNLLTAIGGGGAVGLRHNGSMIIKSVSDIDVTRGLEILPKGKNVELQLDTEVPFSFARNNHLR